MTFSEFGCIPHIFVFQILSENSYIKISFRHLEENGDLTQFKIFIPNKYFFAISAAAFSTVNIIGYFTHDWNYFIIQKTLQY